ncbi:MAG: PrsW family glutamic-type intramembrane protease [Selenomonadaceae bacterium]|uniref:PrsW family glutamic-type intramembrane protease n=1 Tax=Selenomonas bovis TaxID=416586 RepID=UPI00039E0376|nr:PrsW family glutamic-type intramembrane protease [Selenomonas bovis]MCI6159274.1 PrsW family glutamic-type intramembrane protease [Selenomonadaceae bacterium]MDY2685239.1 PrsW family glutamic-type intramembrane protease [Selenomonadaceae bacterium]
MEETKFCPSCGTPHEQAARFCPNCGYDFQGEKVQQAAQPEAISETAKKKFAAIVDNVNHLTGGTEHVELHMHDLVENVFHSHTEAEAEKIFIAGTQQTTPPGSEISSKWPHPWLYSRVFAVLAVTFLLLYFIARQMHNVLVLPGIVFIGALAVPFSLLVFFFEVNAPRNISIFEVTRVFFIGGVLSILMSLIFSNVLNIQELTNSSAFLVGIAEEIGKAAIIAYFLREPTKKYMLNGLLIGAAVGAGFAVFETAGYIMMSQNEDVIYLRGIMALGTHTAWGAMIGAALAMVKKDAPLAGAHLTDVGFLKFLGIAIVLHGVWDMPAVGDFSMPVVQIALSVIVWVFLLVLIHAGLRQVSELGGDSNAA